MIYQERPSPNFGARPQGAMIDTLVLHADASPTVAASLQWMTRAQPVPKDRVSYHVIIGRFGDAYRLVQFEHRAWHAGVAKYREHGDVNSYSVGLCFSNLNNGLEPYRAEQLEAGINVCLDVMRQWPAITLDRVTTHALIAMPPGRKTDPKGFPLADFLYELRLRLEAP